VKICRKYVKKAGKAKEKYMQTAEFQRVVAAAGGVDRVDAYCRAVLEE
jgi:hypothetical protein